MKKVKDLFHSGTLVCFDCPNYMGIGEENFDGSFLCRGTLGIDADENITEEGYPETCPLKEDAKIKIIVLVIKAGFQANGDYISEEALKNAATGFKTFYDKNLKAVVTNLSIPKVLLQHNNEQISIGVGNERKKS